MYDSSHNTHIILPTVGLYTCVAQIAWDNNSVGIRGLRLVQNTYYTIGETTVPALDMPSGYQQQQVSCQPGGIHAGDFLEVYAFQNGTTGTTNLNSVTCGIEAPSVMTAYLLPIS